MAKKRVNKQGKAMSRRQFLKAAAVGAAGLSFPQVASAFSKPVAARYAPALIQSDQEIIMGIGADVQAVDLRTVIGGQAESQILHIEEPLIFPDPQGNHLGILASEWEPVMDAPGWRFKLRPDIVFQNGEPFNAQSVKYTIESIIDPANETWVHSDPRSKLSMVTGVTVEDDLTVLINTRAFDRTLPLNMFLRPMLPPVYGAEVGPEFGQNPIGTGHYKYVEYRSQSHLHLEANPDYRGQWGPLANKALTFRYLTENATRMAALEAGEVHLVDNVPPDAVARLRSNPDLNVLSVPTTRMDGMYFNNGREPFNNVNARLAVAHAVDVQAIVDTIMGGLTEVATSPFPPGFLGVVGETFSPFEYDLDKAREYFSAAGLSNGTPFKMGGPVGRYINDKQVVEAIASMLADVGFAPELEQLEWGTYSPKFAAGEYDMFYLGWAGRGYDPVEFKIVYTGEYSGDNGGLTHFTEYSEQIAELYDMATLTPSQEDAEAAYKELSHLVWDNVPILYLFCEPNIVGMSTRLKGWTPRQDTYTFLWDAYLE